jgi:hypothetical protein
MVHYNQEQKKKLALKALHFSLVQGKLYHQVQDQVLSRCYHNLSFTLATKARAWKCAGRECNLGVTFTFLGVWGNVKE